MAYASYLRNICPSSALPGKMSPHEAMTGDKPTERLKRVRVFGCPVVIYNHTKSKQDNNGLKGYFIGVCPNSRAWRVLVGNAVGDLPTTYRETVDITFDETSALNSGALQYDQDNPVMLKQWETQQQRMKALLELQRKQDIKKGVPEDDPLSAEEESDEDNDNKATHNTHNFR